MIRIELTNVPTELPSMLERVSQTGEVITIFENDRPIAEVRPIEMATTPRPIGLAKGAFTVPDDFFEPLPADVIAAFSGEQS